MTMPTKRRTWLWASLAIAGGCGMIVALDLIEDPDSTPLAIVLNLLEELPLVVITVGVIVLYRSVLRHRDENRRILHDLDLARAQGRRWRSEAQAHIQGLAAAIAAQFSQWGLSAAEGQVALLLLKGFSTKEIAKLRATSERTVREQARSLYAKAELPGRAALSAFFLEDLLPPRRVAEETDLQETQ